jgi:ferredoxin-NADP reductase
MLTYVVENVERITRSTVLLSLRKPANSRVFSYQPGQYAVISYHRHGRPTPSRCFSIVTSPTDPDILQFSMRVRGHFTSGVAELKPGDRVTVRGPFGGFVMEPIVDTDVVMLAGGIGITPFMSMTRYAAAVASGIRLTLYYSCAVQEDIPFLDELTRLAQTNPDFTLIFVIGTGPVDKLIGVQAAAGRITPELLDSQLASRYSRATFFICGPPPFMTGMIKTLQGRGVLMPQIVTEAFAQGPNRQSSLFMNWPKSIYAFQAASFAVGSIGIMASDLVKTLPPSTYLGPNSLANKTALTNTRQTDLDALVNELPPSTSTQPASGAVTTALMASLPPSLINAPVVTTTTQKTVAIAPTTHTVISPTGKVITVTTTPTTPTSPTKAPPVATPVPTPVATPVATPRPKVCTTTQSGVTTCI